MLISVIVTTWGCGQWLEECRASVRAAVAACPAEVEVLEICDGTGAAKARNAGLRRARGEWLVFVDGDDVVSPDFLRLVAGRADAADLIRFRGMRFWDAADFRRDGSARAFPDFWQACACRRTVIPSGGFREFRMGEDRLFLLECLKAASRVVCVDEVVYGYRQHVDSTVWRPVTAERWRDRMAAARAWLAECGEARSLAMSAGEIAAARRVVARDVMGVAALELNRLGTDVWPEWRANLEAVAKLGASVPRLARLQTAICLAFNRRWVARLAVEWPRRLLAHFGG